MTAADAWFLYLESGTVHLHVTGLLILDPSAAPNGFSFAKLRRHVISRLDLLPMLRRRAVEVPLGIDHASWINDPAFDIDNHIRRRSLKQDGSAQALAHVVGEFASIPLDRSRPLWQMLVVDGLDDGTVAVAIKMHHCIIDGVTGMDVLTHLLDITPSPPKRRPSKYQPDPDPNVFETVADATWHRLTTPLRPARAAVNVAGSISRAAAASVGRRLSGDQAAAHPLNAPRTAVNGTITGRRAVAYGTTDLDDFKEIARAFDVKINDVVLACCTTGLRDYLSARDDLPDRALVCSVPVSTHAPDREERSANQVSDMFVNLPVHVADPIERLQLIHQGCLGAKKVQESLGSDMIGDVVELLPASLFHAAARLYSVVGLADRLPPVHNLVVSNVIGAPVPLYLAGAEVVAMYPFGPLMEGTGLNVTVVSSNGQMNIGLITCPDLVDDPDALLEAILGGVSELARAAGRP